MTEKESFATAIRNKATDLILAAADLVKLERIYTARLYGAGGANVITDDDLTSIGVTANDVTLMVYMANDLNSFLTNQSVNAGDRATILHRLRIDA